MVVRSALQAGEDGEIEFLLDVVHDVVALLVLSLDALAVEDHGATRTAE